MSFGYSISDFLMLTKLAWDVVQNSSKACGGHAELTREARSLHIVLQRLEFEIAKPDSLLNRKDDNRREELVTLCSDCVAVLRVLQKILLKYNALSDEERSVKKLWQKIRFGNGEMQDLNEIRLKISTWTSALNLFLNMLSIGSQGRVEKFMDAQGPELRDIKTSVNYIAAMLQAKSSGEGSILTSYTDDDKMFWKEFRRELVKEGFPSSVIKKHRGVIMEYVMELGTRGAMDKACIEEPASGIEEVEVIFRPKIEAESEDKGEELKELDEKNMKDSSSQDDQTVSDETNSMLTSSEDDESDKEASNAASSNGTQQEIGERKGKRAMKEDPPPVPADPIGGGWEALHENKLDNTAQILDLSFGTSTTDTQTSDGSGAWGRSWNTGTKMSIPPITTTTPAADINTNTKSHASADSRIQNELEPQPQRVDMQMCLVPHPFYFGRSGETHASRLARFLNEPYTENIKHTYLVYEDGTVKLRGRGDVEYLCDWMLEAAHTHDQLYNNETKVFEASNNGILGSGISESQHTCMATLVGEFCDLLLRASDCISRTWKAKAPTAPGTTKLLIFDREGLDLCSCLEAFVEYGLQRVYLIQKRKDDNASKRFPYIMSKRAECDFVSGLFDKRRIEALQFYPDLLAKDPLVSTIARLQEIILVWRYKYEPDVRNHGIAYPRSLSPEAEHLWESEKRQIELWVSKVAFRDSTRSKLYVEWESSAFETRKAANKNLETWRRNHTLHPNLSKINTSMVEINNCTINTLLRYCDLAYYRWKLGFENHPLRRRSDQQVNPPIPIPDPGDSEIFEAKWNQPHWKETVLEEMKRSIEWDTLVPLLKRFGFNDTEIGTPGRSKMVENLSREARKRYGPYGRSSSGMISTKEEVFVQGTPVTRTRIWDPNSDVLRS